MAVRIDSLGIDRLSVRDRLDLIEQIWDSLPEQVEPQDIPEWHRAEVAMRRKRAAEEPGVGRPWREVLDRLEGGLLACRSSCGPRQNPISKMPATSWWAFALVLENSSWPVCARFLLLSRRCRSYTGSSRKMFVPRG